MSHKLSSRRFLQALVVVCTVLTAMPASVSARVESNDVLGARWIVTETANWTGTWVRRANSPIFDGTWFHPSGRRAIGTVTVKLAGATIIAERNSTLASCKYQGTLAPDRRSINGTYTCNSLSGTHEWSGRIEYDNGVQALQSL